MAHKQQKVFFFMVLILKCQELNFQVRHEVVNDTASVQLVVFFIILFFILFFLSYLFVCVCAWANILSNRVCLLLSERPYIAQNK